jgi:hypothetical protein
MPRQDAFPEHISLGEKYTPAMTIADQAEADVYLQRCVDHLVTFRSSTPAQARVIERSNLGYWAGYYDHTTRERVERLFNCAHPIFGRIAEVGPPTPDKALLAGVQRRLGFKGRS